MFKINLDGKELFLTKKCKVMDLIDKDDLSVLACIVKNKIRSLCLVVILVLTEVFLFAQINASEDAGLTILSNNIYSIGVALELEGFSIINNITWQKPNPAPNLACRCFTNSTETIL